MDSQQQQQPQQPGSGGYDLPNCDSMFASTATNSNQWSQHQTVGQSVGGATNGNYWASLSHHDPLETCYMSPVMSVYQPEVSQATVTAASAANSIMSGSQFGGGSSSGGVWSSGSSGSNHYNSQINYQSSYMTSQASTSQQVVASKIGNAIATTTIASNIYNLDHSANLKHSYATAQQQQSTATFSTATRSQSQAVKSSTISTTTSSSSNNSKPPAGQQQKSSTNLQSSSKSKSSGGSGGGGCKSSGNNNRNMNMNLIATATSNGMLGPGTLGPNTSTTLAAGSGLSMANNLAPCELEDFAERFKQRRIKLGVTQADVGKALATLQLPGVGSLSQSTICRFESLTLSHNNMIALRPILQAWLETAESQARQMRNIRNSTSSSSSSTTTLTTSGLIGGHYDQVPAPQPRPPVTSMSTTTPTTTSAPAATNYQSSQPKFMQYYQQHQQQQQQSNQLTPIASLATSTQVISSPSSSPAKTAVVSIKVAPTSVKTETISNVSQSYSGSQMDNLQNENHTANSSSVDDNAEEIYSVEYDQEDGEYEEDEEEEESDEEEYGSEGGEIEINGSAIIGSNGKDTMSESSRSRKRKRKEGSQEAGCCTRRTSIAARERRLLEAHFKQLARPTSEQLQIIAEKLDMDKNTVRVWFCNQRQKQKRLKYSTSTTSSSGGGGGGGPSVTSSDTSTTTTSTTNITSNSMTTPANCSMQMISSKDSNNQQSTSLLDTASNISGNR